MRLSSIAVRYGQALRRKLQESFRNNYPIVSAPGASASMITNLDFAGDAKAAIQLPDVFNRMMWN